jgi:hypothetical protein
MCMFFSVIEIYDATPTAKKRIRRVTPQHSALDPPRFLHLVESAHINA